MRAMVMDKSAPGRRDRDRGCWGRRVARLVPAIMLAVATVLALQIGEAALGEQTAFAQTEGRQVTPETPQGGAVPGNALGTTSDSQFWRDIRQGTQGTVSIPDKKLGVLIQSQGEDWRAIRNGPVSVYGSWLMLLVIILVSLFFALAGRVKVRSGMSGRTIQRFGFLDRMAHWLTAGSFVVLALTGLNVLYGKYVLLPVLGPGVFSAITQAGKWAHNFIAFAFMVGIVMMFVMWVKDNIPSKYDLHWMAKFGGLLGHEHPAVEKFNAGQKVVFWITILGGVSVSLSGLALMFPYAFSFFSGTFEVINWFGADLPTNLQPLQEQQLNQVWHAVVALVLIAMIIAHIYIGSIGMEGAFDAMASGRVDENWAKEHHAVWYARVTGRPVPDVHGHTPAE